MVLDCHSCGRANEFVSGFVGRHDTCIHCSADLHCCAQCQFYQAASSVDCREPQAELVKDKDRANFCDFFAAASHVGRSSSDPTDAKAAFEALFKYR